MASRNGIKVSGNSIGISDLNYYMTSGQKFLKLVKDNFTPKKYKVYKTNSTYFLTDKNNKYLGNIQYEKHKNTVKIFSSNSTLKGNFYNIMFTAMFLDGVKEILSDNSLSTGSTKAYKNLSNHFNIKVKSEKSEYLELDDDNIFSGQNIISVRESINITDVFEDLERKMSRVLDGNRLSSLKRSFDLDDGIYEQYMFPEL